MTAPDPSSGGLTEAERERLVSALEAKPGHNAKVIAAVERILADHVATARRDALLEAAAVKARVLALADEWDGIADLVEVPERGFSASYDAANYTARTYRSAASALRAALDPVTPTEAREGT